jgi:nitrile hydratase
MHPATYLDTSYYEHWLIGLQTLLVEKGLLDEAEIERRMAALAAEADA